MDICFEKSTRVCITMVPGNGNGGGHVERRWSPRNPFRPVHQRENSFSDVLLILNVPMPLRALHSGKTCCNANLSDIPGDAYSYYLRYKHIKTLFDGIILNSIKTKCMFKYDIHKNKVLSN